MALVSSSSRSPSRRVLRGWRRCRRVWQRSLGSRHAAWPRRGQGRASLMSTRRRAPGGRFPLLGRPAPRARILSAVSRARRAIVDAGSPPWSWCRAPLCELAFRGASSELAAQAVSAARSRWRGLSRIAVAAHHVRPGAKIPVVRAGLAGDLSAPAVSVEDERGGDRRGTDSGRGLRSWRGVRPGLLGSGSSCSSLPPRGDGNSEG